MTDVVALFPITLFSRPQLRSPTRRVNAGEIKVQKEWNDKRALLFWTVIVYGVPARNNTGNAESSPNAYWMFHQLPKIYTLIHNTYLIGTCIQLLIRQLKWAKGIK